MLIDTNTFLGAWPFSPDPEYTSGKFLDHLNENGIERALVSHFGTVFAPDPIPANKRLLRATKSRPALVPVPVINLNLATWREQIERCLQAASVPAVKILPNYHNYKLSSSRMEAFLEVLHSRGLKLILNVRLNDERGQYFALKVKGVPITGIVSFLNRFPETHPLLTGLYRPELKELAGECGNFSTDIAFCEWRKTVEDLLTVMPSERLVLGTCSPLLSTRAQVDKLRLADISTKSKKQISYLNAKRFFKL